jgi:hypothetical protein
LRIPILPIGKAGSPAMPIFTVVQLPCSVGLAAVRFTIQKLMLRIGTCSWKYHTCKDLIYSDKTSLPTKEQVFIPGNYIYKFYLIFLLNVLQKKNIIILV